MGTRCPGSCWRSQHERLFTPCGPVGLGLCPAISIVGPVGGNPPERPAVLCGRDGLDLHPGIGIVGPVLP